MEFLAATLDIFNQELNIIQKKPPYVELPQYENLDYMVKLI